MNITNFEDLDFVVRGITLRSLLLKKTKNYTVLIFVQAYTYNPRDAVVPEGGLRGRGRQRGRPACLLEGNAAGPGKFRLKDLPFAFF